MPGSRGRARSFGTRRTKDGGVSDGAGVARRPATTTSGALGERAEGLPTAAGTDTAAIVLTVANLTAHDAAVFAMEASASCTHRRILMRGSATSAEASSIKARNRRRARRRAIFCAGVDASNSASPTSPRRTVLWRSVIVERATRTLSSSSRISASCSGSCSTIGGLKEDRS